MFTKHYFCLQVVCSLSCIQWAFSVCVHIGGVCGEPDALHNGRVGTSAGTSFGDVARYSCDTGYTLNGTAERTCQANREWSGSVPTCESETQGACNDQIYFLCTQH